MIDEKFSWVVKESAGSKKTSNWYWVVGILIVGGSVASIIAQNYLFAVLLLVGGFAIMLAGSKRNTRYTFSLHEKGVRVGTQAIPFEKVKRFSISDKTDPPTLILDTESFTGLITVPILSADYREVRMFLKNKNIEEEENLQSATDHIAKMVGL
ncbi:hypothetical protein COU15_02640 [Candidatus Kaiserbacteria bacterium CG10_big_fil_rev_8_21_14_0_10_45_20]|uniref:DUF5673 domain-containing protein n=1 Tax=Candidatus Kaiserbacteria bacterium CG10_big_fil_rev_8_21_14_0_10_45_20 TaxID=1974607 RepID=A0A2H0UF57_9BACT|nr:MAG: hypothetical protein COU15_02640 [Candidatus Kaiserbacteria bacterium CG10_big_fil_rev_8_21_14_0_10_45_20]